MKKTVIQLVLLTAALVCVLSVTAMADKEKDPAKMSGKELYKIHCKSCHDVDSEFGEYTPMFLIMEQWERFFDEDYAETHKDVKDPSFEDRKVIEIITPDLLKKIREFCIEGAADGEHPMTCG